MQTAIDQARKGDRTAQRQLYEHLSPWCLGVCRLYIKDLSYAEDVMITGFAKVLKNLVQFREESSLKTWVKKIMINECITFLRKKKIEFAEELSSYENQVIAKADQIDLLENKEIQAMIDQLPDGCRMVFNLYVFEDYTHKEIAENLSISEGTSKSQLAYARKILKEMFTSNNKVSHG
jgi:RNA polymerase sigma-70 factor, ECF subfamily